MTLRWCNWVLIIVATLLIGACMPRVERPTLDELGATEFAGLGGPGLHSRCATPPDASEMVNFSCGSAPDTGAVSSALAEGGYAVVLLSDGPDSYRHEATQPVDAF